MSNIDIHRRHLLAEADRLSKQILALPDDLGRKNREQQDSIIDKYGLVDWPDDERADFDRRIGEMKEVGIERGKLVDAHTDVVNELIELSGELDAL